MNLSEVVIRSTDSYDDIKQKVRIATIIGTLQSTLTDFTYLRKVWKQNCEEERLLGVSLTGICDNKNFITNTFGNDLEQALRDLKQVAIDTNKEWSEKLGINQSTATTCNKPSGTVSQLVNSSSGIHPRFSDYYIRRIRQDKKDPLTAFLMDEGVPWEEDVMNSSSVVFSFPQSSPSGAVCNKDVSAIDQLEMWLLYQNEWCEHKPSCTVYVKEGEWLEVGAWVYKHFDKVSGVSFLPMTDHIYQQAPYEEITKEQYEELIKDMPKSIDWEGLERYELEDATTSSHELACSGGSCEI